MTKREPRLKFTQEEKASPQLKKAIQKVEKAEAKADVARAKIPQKAVKEKVMDPTTRKVTTKIRFVDKKPPSELFHTATTTPLNTLSGMAHREIRQYEDENIGLKASHFAESGVESGTRLTESAIHAQRLRPYRKAAATERKLEKANLNALYKKAEGKQPSSNPLSRLQQRRTIRKKYAAEKAKQNVGTVKRAAENAGKAVERIKEAAKKTVGFVQRHRKGLLAAGGMMLVLTFMLNVFSSCSVILQSLGTSVAASTYPSEDEEMLGAEAVYCEMEIALKEYLDTYESTHDYDEYHFDLDEIEHDPYVLISILTALKGGEWTLAEMEDTLILLFQEQYTLTEDAVTETRYKTETRTGTKTVTDPDTGEETEVPYEYEVEVPYEYTICSVTLRNFNLSHLPVYIMDSDQFSSYAVYMSTLGNRPDLFPTSPYVGKYTNGYTNYEIPPEALDDEQFAAIITEAEKYLGYPYVWGGSSPSTSFDCSGFVSWVINHSGWDVGRLGVDALYGICTPVSAAEAKPGDLVFFQGTYDTTGMSHVGIYVGNSTMIHCGDPISYANLNSSYWQAHFAGFGRLP
jgi:cell wall-associated NlpC family hydrolase